MYNRHVADMINPTLPKEEQVAVTSRCIGKYSAAWSVSPRKCTLIARKLAGLSLFETRSALTSSTGGSHERNQSDVRCSE